MRLFQLSWVFDAEQGGGFLLEGYFLAESAEAAESFVYAHHAATDAGRKRGTVRHWQWSELTLLNVPPPTKGTLPA